jgi:hypothetical protein
MEMEAFTGKLHAYLRSVSTRVRFALFARPRVVRQSAAAGRWPLADGDRALSGGSRACDCGFASVKTRNQHGICISPQHIRRAESVWRLVELVLLLLLLLLMLLLLLLLLLMPVCW